MPPQAPVVSNQAPAARGDPESPLRWTCKSVRKLSAQLKEMGHDASHNLVAQLLAEMGYSLQANRKTIEAFLKRHHAEGLSSRLVTVEEMFHPATHESFAI